MIAALILAGGESKRMGSPKALLKIGGKTFVEYIKDTLIEAGASPILILLGHEADKIRASINAAGASVLMNPDYVKGQVTSIQRGIRHLDDCPARGILLCPVDTPLFSAHLAARLIQAGEKEEHDIVIPTYDGRRGHPAFFARRLYPDLLSAPHDQGARWVVKQHPGDILEISADEEGIIQNINTPKDYELYVASKHF